jgi:DMSO/TMAO reductase YedYZ molybdopterin-dependent catalytic subunit
VSAWRLLLTGSGLSNPVELTYEELLAFPTTKGRAQLVCPGLFGYFAEWEGVPLSALLILGKAANGYAKVTFSAVDGYAVSFTREEVEGNRLFLATRVYGKTLPPFEGFPLRLVADGFSGGKWVRWLKEIRVE